MKRTALLRSLNEISMLELELENIGGRSLSRRVMSEHARRVIREQDEADVRRFNFQTMDINALNGRFIWDVLAELRDEGDLRDALKNSWGDDDDERAVAAQKYIWNRVFDGGRREYTRWVVYLPPEKITYKGVTLKELGVRELRVEVGMAGTPGTRINPMPAPKAYWWLQYFAASYVVYGLLPVKYKNRYEEVWIGDLRMSKGFLGGAVGPEAAINGVGFYFSDKGEKAIDDLLKQYQDEEKFRRRRDASASGDSSRSDKPDPISEVRKKSKSVVKKGGKKASAGSVSIFKKAAERAKGGEEKKKRAGFDAVKKSAMGWGAENPAAVAQATTMVATGEPVVAKGEKRKMNESRFITIIREVEKKSSRSSSRPSSKKQEPLPPIPSTLEFEREMRDIVAAYDAGEDIESWLTQDILGSKASPHGLSRKTGWSGDEDLYRKPSASYIAQHLATNRDPELRAIGQRVLSKMGERLGSRRFSSMGSGFGLEPIEDLD